MKNRIFYVDLLRVVAIFFVILLHVAAINWSYIAGLDWYNVPLDSWLWKVSNFYSSIGRFCVPVFFMISGMFFLDPNYNLSLEKLFKKNILRIVTAYIFWSALYAVTVSWLVFSHTGQFTVTFLLERFFLGNYHLWFLYAIIGLYLIVPFLRLITVHNKLLKYFLLLSLIFAIIIPTLQLFAPFTKTKEITDDISLYFVMGYVFYFMLGYYLANINTAPYKFIYIILGIIGALSTTILTYVSSVQANYPDGRFLNYLVFSNVLLSVAVFLFFKDFIGKLSFKEKNIKVILLFSNFAFGMYLCHDFFVKIFTGMVAMFDPVLSIPLVTIVVFLCSFIVVAVLNKIPVLNKYII